MQAGRDLPRSVGGRAPERGEPAPGAGSYFCEGSIGGGCQGKAGSKGVWVAAGKCGRRDRAVAAPLEAAQLESNSEKRAFCLVPCGASTRWSRWESAPLWFRVAQRQRAFNIPSGSHGNRRPKGNTSAPPTGGLSVG